MRASSPWRHCTNWLRTAWWAKPRYRTPSRNWASIRISRTRSLRKSKNSMRRLSLWSRVWLLFSSGLFLSLSSLAQVDPSSTSQRATFTQRLVAAAVERTRHVVRYDPAYVRIPYPGGDVPSGTGVCTDEIIRIYRTVGVDLQKEVHEDLQANFWSYPNHLRWMLFHTDTNIDHRRVPNLMW